MEQISQCIAQPLFQGDLCVSVGDCAYSDSYCLQEANKNPNQIHISRAKNNRLFYRTPKKGKKRLGRPKQFGKKFPLKNKRRRKPDESTSINITTAKAGN